MSRYKDEFLRGFMVGSGLRESTLAGRAYAEWLEREGYAEVERIDLESGGFAAGLVVGQKWRETKTFICPDCGAVSYNPSDIKHRYCGRCQEFKN